MSELPSEWLDAELSEVAEIIRGVTYKREQAADAAKEGFVPVLRATNITGMALIFDELVYVPAENVSDEQLLKPGDVVIASSSGSKEIVGKSGAFVGGGFVGSFGAFCTGIRPSIALSAVYFGYYFQTPSYRKSVSELSAGSNINNLKIGDLATQRFPFPPLSEQTRIVAKLEELLSDLDAAVAELKAAQKKLAQYRQSLLKAAVEGALTAAWRAQHTPTETGAQLLQRILTERRTRWETKQLAKFESQGKAPPKDWQKKYPEPVQPDTTDLPTLPERWIWASVEQISEIQGGIQKQPSRAPKENKFPFLRVANVVRGKLKLDEVHEIELFPGELERLALIAGDVLIVEGNGSLTEIGRCARWDGSIANAVHQNHLIRVRSIGVLSQFIETWLNSLGGIEKLTKLAATTSGLYTLSVGKISKIPVPIAPLAEQEVSMRILVERLSALDSQEHSVEHSLKQSAAQRQNILRAAFAGQLVPQDPNDEPASVLLARIRAERVEREKQPKVRKTKQHKEIAAVVSKLIDVLAEAGDWVPAQEAFQRCGVAFGAQTDQIEALYAELRALDKVGRLAVETVTDAQGRKLHDRLKLLAI